MLGIITPTVFTTAPEMSQIFNYRDFTYIEMEYISENKSET